ncbi:ABC transporter ATP-binding protein [Candidatus Venteria ishoeyi]|uniref:Teichoic acids export ATP-binding protein TagH n=1 Tax=Candidatus Venteria ishoeyi TaxID=1899563 RepID=A0A1H6F614_9GAMM|nr:ABC transporter ATP-binding protein [Candidatus Venteria ishoeyi]SEH05590.1 Teichoic acids export ATP-binding protein TagH [Candidatus Venteria ishoeyi]SEH07069.1 Teichoic acids export ATP-binding protein TagH [Candidatus Venteria ishoeyi]
MNAIEATNLSKVYRLYAKPVHRLKEILLRRPCHQAFHSLQNISFTLPQGGGLGIIGDNGAGKSTLLKLLTGTLQPTEGHIQRNGKVAALLELGTGFHPELSGRENIRLSATVQGLSAEEINQREAEIIAFSELEAFIDRPVKTYSSGMYVRLGFAVSTCIDPDILIIDEALSVGDHNFQKKCIERMMQFKDANKTILFCSHSMHLVQEICQQALWLEQGVMRAYGSTEEVIGAYTQYLESKQYQQIETASNAQVSVEAHLPPAMITEFQVTDKNNQALEVLQQFKDVVIHLKMKGLQDKPMKAHIGIALLRPDEQIVFVASTKESGLSPELQPGEQSMTLTLPSFPLATGVYRFSAMIVDEFVLRIIHEQRSELYAVHSRRPEYGLLWMPHDWDFDLQEG